MQIAEKYKRLLPNFVLLKNEKNEGLVSSCNKALKEINTQYFLRLDADDYLSEDALVSIEKELRIIKGEDIVVFHRWDIFDSSNEINVVRVSQDIFSWIATGVMFKTQSVKNVQGYSDEYWEEYDLYIKLLEAGCKFKISSYCIYYYRRGHGSLTKCFDVNKKGFDCLVNKWGLDIIQKYGNFRYFFQYYLNKGSG